jgi:hypothetical protein
MLSNKENSVAHHAEIVTECARVLTMRSSLVSVSQQNAHTLNGNCWLDDVNGNDQISVEEDPVWSRGQDLRRLKARPFPSSSLPTTSR